MNPVKFFANWLLGFFESPASDLVVAYSVAAGFIVTFACVAGFSFLLVKCYGWVTGKNISDTLID